MSVTLITSITFIALLYVLPLQGYLERRVVLAPAFGREGSWLFTALLIYLALYMVFTFMLYFYELLWPGLPRLLADMSRRRGIFQLDGTMFRTSLLAIVVFALMDLNRLPLAVASALGFGSLVRLPVKLRPVGSTRGGDQAAAAGTEAARESDRQVTRRLAWQLDEAMGPALTGEIEILVDEDRYRRQAADNPTRGGRAPKLRAFVEMGRSDEVTQLTTELFAISQEHGFSSFQELSCALAVVQAIPDGRSKHLKLPVEVLYAEQGDGNSKAALFAALVKSMDYEALLLERNGSLAVAVSGVGAIPGRFVEHEGERYYYCAPASPGSRPGQLPPGTDQDQFRIHPL